MRIDLETGLLREARQVVSENADARPDGCVPELIVIHNISLPPGEFGGPWIERLFTNCLPADRHPYFAEICDLRVSSHLLIGRQGQLTQFVPFHMRAWHAGQSSYRGRQRCNDYSIGIELEGADDVVYEDVQYSVLAHTLKALLQAYPGLSRQHITGHSDVAPDRKTDPGPAFDWHRILTQIDE